MQQRIEIGEANIQLSHLLKEVEKGFQIVFTRDGQPVARIVPEDKAVEANDLLEMPAQFGPNKNGDLSPEQSERASRGLAAIEKLRQEIGLSVFNLEEFKRDRDEGRH